MKIRLNGKEVSADDVVKMLVEAVDSHIYWQLADERYRNNGHVVSRGSDDPVRRMLIDDYEDLHTKLIGLSNAMQQFSHVLHC
jgi:hypothetical protein